jgi:hypothetical protein
MFQYSNAGFLYFLDQKRILAKQTLYGRRQQFVSKWKTASVFWQTEDDLNILANGRQPQHFCQ